MVNLTSNNKKRDLGIEEDLRKRLVWSALVSLLALIGIVSFNYYLLTHALTPSQERDRNFVSIVLVESILVFLTSFVVINSFFTLHPDYTSLVYEHKKVNPQIPKEYYKDTLSEDNKDKEEINKAVDKIADAVEKEKEERQDKDNYPGC